LRQREDAEAASARPCAAGVEAEGAGGEQDGDEDEVTKLEAELSRERGSASALREALGKGGKKGKLDMVTRNKETAACGGFLTAAESAHVEKLLGAGSGAEGGGGGDYDAIIVPEPVAVQPGEGFTWLPEDASRWVLWDYLLPITYYLLPITYYEAPPGSTRDPGEGFTWRFRV
jgi:hypothetical protein